MSTRTTKKLDKLFEWVKKGSKGFNVESVKPHLDIFISYGAQCKTVTEFGVETGCSTAAFLTSGCKKVYSYDVKITPNARLVKQAADEDGVFFKLFEKDNLKVIIKKTDLLFIDTDHWYGQIKAELSHHHPRVKKWIMMHDTETFGVVNPFDGRPGMKAAIYEFLEEHPEWQIKEHFEIGHGLTILERQGKTKKKWFW
jgi:cephalosporin hydroxylase